MLSHAKQVKIKKVQFQFQHNDTIASGEKVQLIEGRDLGKWQMKEIVYCPLQLINIVWYCVTASVNFCSVPTFLCINLHSALQCVLQLHSTYRSTVSIFTDCQYNSYFQETTPAVEIENLLGYTR